MSEEMTNKQAMEILEAARKTMYLPKSGKYISDMGYALEKGIAALEAEPCDDAISRQEALDCLNGKIKMSPDMVETFREYLQGVIDAIEGLASVMPEKRAGHWIISPNDCFATCSECGLNGDKGIFKHYRWCPICGAKMVVEPPEIDHKCHTCKHYTSGEDDGSCGSYICKGYSNWESEG